MTSLSLNNISKSFGIDQILEDVTFSLQDDMRLGIVGPNGAGKTTLLRIICGEMESDNGTISIPSNISVGYLQQEAANNAETTVWDTMLSVFEKAFDLEKKMRNLEHDMETASADQTQWDKISREYERVTVAFEEAGGYGYKSAIGGVLKGLGLTEDVYDRQVITLSGGQRSRLMLAKLLLEKPGLLLLDEPTNHLDTNAISWLESYLKTWDGAVVIVSHDRWFLDQLCTHIADLHNGVVDTYIGNYTSYIAQRQEKRRLQMKAYEHNQRELGRQQKIVDQYYAWGRMNSKNFVKAKAREKMLDKMERLDKVENERSKISLRLNSSNRGGNEVLQATDLAMAFDACPLFSGLDIRLGKGDKAALIGANGIGKTTLLRIIVSKIASTQGEVRLGSNIEISYYDQLQENLDKSKTVMEEMQDAFTAKTDGDIRNALASFLFYGDDVFKKISALSGGEKGRLSLLKMMLGKGNLLLLDEPTNHLDMDSKEILEEALCEFEGTVLFVSHDRYFINKVANRVLEMKREEVTQYDGNWSDYIEFLDNQNNPQEEQDTGLTKTATAKMKRAEKEKENEVREAKKRVAQIEQDIQQMEERLEGIEKRLADPEGLEDTQLVEISKEHESVQQEIDSLMQAWEDASSEIA